MKKQLIGKDEINQHRDANLAELHARALVALQGQTVPIYTKRLHLIQAGIAPDYVVYLNRNMRQHHGIHSGW